MPSEQGFVYWEPYDRLQSGMRVSDRVLKSVLFIGRQRDGRFTPTATAFLVIKKYKEGGFIHIVTCAHAVTGQAGLCLRVNTKAGGPEIIPLAPGDWVYHPDASRFVDVAVMPLFLDPAYYDIATIPLTDFLLQDRSQERDVGIGEELFYPSLFAYHHGTGRNLPMMRSATLAGMPVEKIQTPSGPIEAYLIEGRSIAGHSGSPVFVNLMVDRHYYTETPRGPLPHPLQAQRYLLLGLIRGFIKASDAGEYITDVPPDQEDLWVNSGISTVIPAWDIFETIEQEELEVVRQTTIETARAQSAETPASIVSNETEGATVQEGDNPSHKEDFTRLLDAAAQANKPVS